MKLEGALLEGTAASLVCFLKGSHETRGVCVCECFGGKDSVE